MENSKEKIFICDIDGTLADKGARNPYDESRVLNDTALPTCEVINGLINIGYNIVFLSGRTDKCQADSEKWLVDNIKSLYKPTLLMRKNGDMRSDDIIKEELYNSIKDKYEVMGVFDDRLKVCRMWYRLGLFVLNCNQGLKEF